MNAKCECNCDKTLLNNVCPMTEAKPSPMVDPKSWEEFQSTGLLLYINQVLHIFGWAIVLEYQDGKPVGVYPARVKFRGFDHTSVGEAYVKLTGWLKKNIKQLDEEVKE